MLHVMVAMLDHPLNDIYIHIDKKVDITPFLGAATKWSNVYYLPKRINVEWGSTSQIETELLIFEYANNNGHYSYFHMMSGQDLPLQPQDVIHHFFDNQHPGLEFVTINPHQDEKDIEYKTRYFHYFVKSLSDTQHSLSHYWHYYLHGITVRAQKIIGIQRTYPCALKKSTHFVSITRGFVSYLLAQKDYIRKTFAHTLCADEIFLQTILWNSSFRHNLYSPAAGIQGNMRYIVWENQKAHIWKDGDFESLLSSPYLFALKFTSSDKGLLLKIAEHNDCYEEVERILENAS